MKERVRIMPGGRPPDVDDKDVVEAILTEVEWEEEGIPESPLTGWWSDRWASPAGKSDLG
ncbi:MAG: hypothetical protein NUW23_07500 [Firmicutes bacterium]|jgi:hypothetical protein|nr:hypothetical protein [Bacillota bacterium]